MAGDRVFNFNGANVTFNDIHDNTNCTINTCPEAKDLSDVVEEPIIQRCPLLSEQAYREKKEQK